MASCRAAQSTVMRGERFLVLGNYLNIAPPQCEGGCSCHSESCLSIMTN